MKGLKTAARQGGVLAVTVIALALAQHPPTAAVAATQSVKLTATLTPDRPGADTTLGFNFHIAAPPNRVPPPLTALELRYPADISIGTSGLGLQSCEATTLTARGPAGCPTNARMGNGSATVEIQIGPNIVTEKARISAWMAPLQNEHFAVLFYAAGESPVEAQLILPSVLLQASSPFGGDLDTAIPIIPSLPGASDVAIVQMQVTIGPQDITYYRHAHGKTVPYQPAGLRLPHSCPHRGYPFAAAFRFLDGTQARARATVSCRR